MGVPTSEVGYTPAMPRREDHEVHKDMWWHWTKKKKELPNVDVNALSEIFLSGLQPKIYVCVYNIFQVPLHVFPISSALIFAKQSNYEDLHMALSSIHLLFEDCCLM